MERLPPQETRCCFMRNQRPTLKNPKEVTDFDEIPEQYSGTISPKQHNFLLYDNGARNDKRNLVLAFLDFKDAVLRAVVASGVF